MAGDRHRQTHIEYHPNFSICTVKASTCAYKVSPKFSICPDKLNNIIYRHKRFQNWKSPKRSSSKPSILLFTPGCARLEHLRTSLYWETKVWAAHVTGYLLSFRGSWSLWPAFFFFLNKGLWENKVKSILLVTSSFWGLLPSTGVTKNEGSPFLPRPFPLTLERLKLPAPQFPARTFSAVTLLPFWLLPLDGMCLQGSFSWWVLSHLYCSASPCPPSKRKTPGRLGLCQPTAVPSLRLPKAIWCVRWASG